MATYSIFLVVVAVFVLSFHGIRDSSEAKPEAKEPSTDPFRVDLIHRDSPLSPLAEGQNLSNVERLRRAIELSHSRLRRFQRYTSQNGQSYNDSPLNYSGGAYFMKMAIGTPVQHNLHFIVDTDSNLIWTQCEPCGDSCVKQNDPIYNPFHSSSYRNQSCFGGPCNLLRLDGEFSICDSHRHCAYTYVYENDVYTSGILAAETFNIASASSSKRTSIPNLSFGCGHVQHGDFLGSSGIVGLGRGANSLISQIGSSIHNIFSYCLASLHNASQISPLFLGKAPTFRTAYSVTPLLRVANINFVYSYYLGLDGIDVAGKPVPLPEATFSIQADGSGGLIIDCGSQFTYLEAAGYKPFRDAVRSSISVQPVTSESATTHFDLCYHSTPRLVLPNITFHFGGGADYVLPPENSFTAATGGLVCLAFLPSQSVSIFGNFQQQNFHIVYDLGRNELSFAPGNCAAL